MISVARASRLVALIAALSVGRLGAQDRPSEQTVPDSTLRRAVTEHFPGALTGAFGPRPAVWFIGDSANAVLHAAEGKDALANGLTWRIARRKLGRVPPSMSPGDLMQWGKVPVGQDTVDVIWVRLRNGLTAR